MAKKFFVTGGAGFIGSALARKALEKGHEVHVLTRRTTNLWRLNDIISGIRLHEGDLTDNEGLVGILKKIKPEIIFHTAVSNVYGGNSASEKELFSVNLLGAINLYNAASVVDYELFINTGTSSEYGSKNSPMKESDICKPVFSHGIFKLAATLYGQMLAKNNGRPIATIRPFSPYGPFDDPKRFTTAVILNALRNKGMDLSNPAFARDYIYIDDLAELYFDCIEKAADLKGEIFNGGTGRQRTLRDVTDIVLKITNSKMQLRWDVFKPAVYDTGFWQADMTKTFGQFKWRPKESLESGMEKFVNWIESNSSLYL